MKVIKEKLFLSMWIQFKCLREGALRRLLTKPRIRTYGRATLVAPSCGILRQSLSISLMTYGNCNFEFAGLEENNSKLKSQGVLDICICMNAGVRE